MFPIIVGLALAAGISAGFRSQEPLGKIRKAKKFRPDRIGEDARFGGLLEAWNKGLLSNEGVYLGIMKIWGKQVFFNDLTSLLSFGGSGSGKTSSILIPACLMWKGSLAAVDMTGELATVIAKGRRRFGPVYQLNPQGAFSCELRSIPRAKYNPIDRRIINLKKDRSGGTAKIQRIAQGLVPVRDASQVYWSQTSGQLAADFIEWAVEFGADDECDLVTVAKWISDDPFGRAKWMLEHAKGNEFLQARLKRWVNGRKVKSLGEAVENLRSELNFLLDPGIAEVIRGQSTVTFAQLKAAVASIFMVTPDGTDNRILRLFVSAMKAELFTDDGRQKVLVTIDEYPKLQIADIGEWLVEARKYKVIPWLLMQGLAQFKVAHPGVHDALLGSAGALQFLDATDLDSSNYISAMCGDRAVVSDSKSFSTGALNNPDSDRLRAVRPNKKGLWEVPDVNVSEGKNQTRVPLISAQDVRYLKADEQVMLLKSMRGIPILASRKPYWKMPVGNTASPNPFYKK
jgi:type IV secretion system protein VirD4